MPPFRSGRQGFRAALLGSDAVVRRTITQIILREPPAVNDFGMILGTGLRGFQKTSNSQQPHGGSGTGTRQWTQDPNRRSLRI